MPTFQNRQPNIENNEHLRIPQRAAFKAMTEFIEETDQTPREVGIVLPVGCGKSGCITLTPFAFRSKRTLVIAPNLSITQQLNHDFDPGNPQMFYQKCGVLEGEPFPEPVEIRGANVNRSDLDEGEVVITNIHQLQGQDNRWLQELPPDFFDLIIFDEGHHGVANSWRVLKEKFPHAKIVNFSATPLRADGQLMAGQVIYSYPVSQAIQEGYVKRLKGIVLNPRSLRYVRNEDGEEIEVSLDEVRTLGEEDADFRRSIVTSTETLNTIVDASIRQLDQLRASTGENRLKIIASALNYEHCRQIVEAYRARGRRADYVHSREDQPANNLVMQRLENHELDVIIQVRKLGEGFDHPYLSVAAVFSIFSNLSPFIQFVGRIMRVIEQNNPDSPTNQGVVVFHAGANVARRWDDFREYSQADQEYFDQLLPLEDIDLAEMDEEREIVPRTRRTNETEVRGQEGVLVQEIPLLSDDPEAMDAVRLLRDRGYITEGDAEELQRIPVTRQRQRQAMRGGLDMRVKNETARILRERGISSEGRGQDRQHPQRTNWVNMKAAIDLNIARSVNREPGQRHEYSREELDTIDQNFDALVAKAEEEVFGA
jgi:superfamily II DNA or RNA helicase